MIFFHFSFLKIRLVEFDLTDLLFAIFQNFYLQLVHCLLFRLEKDYMSMKEREHEEQVEMKRLRTENRLLRQRIESLEKENVSLADKLIQV